MGCRILSGDDGAVMYCSTTGWCFGPVFDTAEAAEDFVKMLDDKGVDPRKLTLCELDKEHIRWLRDFTCEVCGRPRTECDGHLTEVK